MDQDNSSYNSIVNKEVPKPVAWNAESAPLTGIGKMKKEMVYIFWFEFIGTFLLTFSIYASNNNAFVLAGIYGLLILVAQNQKCSFNPAITSTLAINDNGTWVTVAIASQFFGAFIAGIVGLASFSNYVDSVPYLNPTTLGSFPAVAIGEVLGAAILTIGFLFQYDELLDYSNERIEHSVVISGLYGVGRTLTYISQSSLNPAIALSLCFFESCKDGDWSRFWTSFVFIGLPFVGAFIALTFIHILYKKCYEQQIKIGLRL